MVVPEGTSIVVIDIYRRFRRWKSRIPFLLCNVSSETESGNISGAQFEGMLTDLFASIRVVPILAVTP